MSTQYFFTVDKEGANDFYHHFVDAHEMQRLANVLGDACGDPVMLTPMPTYHFRWRYGPFIFEAHKP